MLALTELALLACARPPAAEVQGRELAVPATGLSLRWPEGWTLAIEPELFRSGLPDLVAEGRREDTRVALSLHAMPGGEALGLDTALDRLLVRWPLGPAQTGTLQRLPRCGGAIEQSLVLEDQRRFYRYAWSVDAALAVLSAWATDGEPDRTALRALVCGRDW